MCTQMRYLYVTLHGGIGDKQEVMLLVALDCKTFALGSGGFENLIHIISGIAVTQQVGKMDWKTRSPDCKSMRTMFKSSHDT